MGLRWVDAGWRCRPLQWDKLNESNNTIGMEHFCFEDHLGWLVGELDWEP